MSTYPGGIYSPRTKENKQGVVYTPAKSTISYAEDITKLDDEVVAIETDLKDTSKVGYTGNYFPILCPPASLTGLNWSSLNIKIVPNLKSMTLLEGLYLGGNILTSITIPAELTVLNTLGLENNYITSITIPAELTLLTTLLLNGNQLDLTSVDTILATLDAGGQTGGLLDLSGGTNAVPTGGASNANYLSLIAKSWSVTINT